MSDNPETKVENPTPVPADPPADTSPETERVEVPAAVFLTTLGCHWTTLPEFVTEEDARNSRRAVLGFLKGNKIEPSEVEMVKGVQYCGEYAIVFSLQNVSGMDQAGRDSDYYACAFVNKERMAQLDFYRLLQNDYFVKPSENPSSSIDCTDMVCDGLLGRLMLLPEFGESRWLIASAKVNGRTTLYLKCDNWNDTVVEGLRSVLSATELDAEQVVDRKEEQGYEHKEVCENASVCKTDEVQMDRADNAGDTAGEISCQPDETDWQSAYVELCKRYNDLQGNLELQYQHEIDRQFDEYSKKAEVEIRTLRDENEEYRRENSNLSGRINGCESQRDVLNDKLAKLESEWWLWMIVIGISAFVMGVCFMFAFAYLVK